MTDRVVAEPPAFGVALAHVWPSELPEETVEAVAAAAAAAAAVGVQDGPTYTQVLSARTGRAWCELAARLGGGHDAELCEAALGVDLNALALAAALGERLYDGAFVPDELAGGACVRFLVPEPGVLEAVEGSTRRSARAGSSGCGATASRATSSAAAAGGDRAGAVLAVGDSRKEAVTRAERAASKIRIVTAEAEALV